MRWWHIAVLGAVGVLGIASLVVVPYALSHREARYGPKCRSNLEQIVIACQIYSACANERFPLSLDALFGYCVSDGRVFLCPAAGKAVELRPSDIPKGARDASAIWSDRYTDYGYVPWLGTFAPADAVLVFDREGSHRGGRWVGLAGGKVTWMKEPGFRAALAETEAWVEERIRRAPALEGDRP